MTPKDLKKLVKVCRDLGVTHYKGEGFEFTLSDSLPVKETRKKSTSSKPDTGASDFETDTPSYDEMLFWSAPALSSVSDEDKV